MNNKYNAEWKDKWDEHMVNAIQEIAKANDAAPHHTQAANTASALLELTDCMHSYTRGGFDKHD